MIKYFYPKTIRNITVAILDMFNDIKVYKTDADGNVKSIIKVPVSFGPVEKYHQDRKENHYFDKDNKEHNERSYAQLPFIAIVPTGISYDSERATGVNEFRSWIKESMKLSDSHIDEVFTDYQPTPYNYSYTVHIRSDSVDYTSQILENILPFFNPSLMLRVKEISFLNIERDIPVLLDGVGFDFSDDMSSTDYRVTNSTLTLTVKGYMYRPITKQKIIKYVSSEYINKYSDDVLANFITSGAIISGGVVDSDSIPNNFHTSGYKKFENREYNWYKNDGDI